MRFYADLHVHSRFSRGTSPALELPELARWATIKGLAVVGCGDFTHPAWFERLRSSLAEAAPGLYALKEEPGAGLPPWAGARPRPLFMLSAEISLIFTQGGRVRKVHLLLLAPALETVGRINTALGRRFNLNADGRPILGATARDIAAELLAIDERVLVIPAHIWTPWFSLLGSRSGFDSLEECFLDMTPAIRAVETGLSADPPMLGRVTSLAQCTVLSNSDAHSAPNLGREASEFDCPLAYDAIAAAIRGDGIVRTIEFFPEEGKYHHDGHRGCGVSLSPRQARPPHNAFPACGRPLTPGVLHRLEEPADRPDPGRARFAYQVPLRQILARLLGCGEGARKVDRLYVTLIERLGPEFAILQETPLAAIAASEPRLAAAVAAVRAGRVRRVPGHDGVYGTIDFAAGDLGD